MSQAEDRTRVVILTNHYRINGEIALVPGARLTDYIVGTKVFVAVTNAEVSSLDGRRLFDARFLNVHRDQIEIIAPADDVTPR